MDLLICLELQGFQASHKQSVIPGMNGVTIRTPGVKIRKLFNQIKIHGFVEKVFLDGGKLVMFLGPLNVRLLVYLLVS